MTYDELLNQNHLQANTIRQLLTEIQQLKEEIARLKRRNSKNSSSPPSHDFKKNHKPNKNKGGAVKGHAAHQRALISEDRVSSTVHCEIDRCPKCDKPLREVGTSLLQNIEMEGKGLLITNYIRHKYRCTCCHKELSANLPEGIGLSPFGPRFQAMVCVLTSHYHLSKRKVVSLMKDLFDLCISVGVISKIVASTASILKPAYEEIRDVILNGSEVVGADETGWRHSATNFYLWLMSTDDCTYFHIDRRRNKEARTTLLGERFSNPLITDRFIVYRDLNVPHQYCLSHIIRNIKAFEEVKGITGVRAKTILREFKEIFLLWHRYKAKEIPKSSFKRRSYYRRNIIKEILEDIYLGTHDKFRRLAKSLLEGFDCLFTYLRVDGMEPTNNRSERDLRCMVIFRKISHGTRGEGGLIFVPIAGSVIQTLRKQKRDVLDYISSAISNSLKGLSPSSLFDTNPV